MLYRSGRLPVKKEAAGPPPNHRAGSRMYSVEVKTVKRHTDTLGDQGLTMATL